MADNRLSERKAIEERIAELVHVQRVLNEIRPPLTRQAGLGWEHVYETQVIIEDELLSLRSQLQEKG